MTDASLRTTQRHAHTGDPHALAAWLAPLARGGVPSDLTVGCDGSGGEYNCVGGDLPAGIVWGLEKNTPVRHSPCRGTGRVPWPWEGPTGRIALAAYCGSPAAREVDPGVRSLPAGGAACRWEAPAGSSWWVLADAWGLSDWLDGLQRWPPEALRRAAIAAGWVALPVWEERHCAIHREWQVCPDTGIEICDPMEGCIPPPSPRRALEAAQAHEERPCSEHREGWGGAWRALGTYTVTAWPSPADDDRASEIQAAARLATEPVVRSAICEALIAWSLGG